jgi:hypothetical protein
MREGKTERSDSSKSLRNTAVQKKEEFSGNMENMRPENSFPRSALFLK